MAIVGSPRKISHSSNWDRTASIAEIGPEAVGWRPEAVGSKVRGDAHESTVAARVPTTIRTIGSKSTHMATSNLTSVQVMASSIETKWKMRFRYNVRPDADQGN